MEWILGDFICTVDIFWDVNKRIKERRQKCICLAIGLFPFRQGVDRIVKQGCIEKYGERMKNDGKGMVAGKNDKDWLFTMHETVGAIVHTMDWRFGCLFENEIGF